MHATVPRKCRIKVVSNLDAPLSVGVLSFVRRMPRSLNLTGVTSLTAVYAAILISLVATGAIAQQDAESTSGSAAPLPGSQLPAAENMCAQCHGDQQLWQGDKARFHVSADDLALDIHWNRGVNCHDCHGGDFRGTEFSRTHRKEDGFRATAAEIRESCNRCHRETMVEVTRKSVHAKAGVRGLTGGATSLDCGACHGEVKHQLLSSEDPRSPVFPENRMETCGACHQRELESHMHSVHSPNLEVTGAIPRALCSDCHGTHGIYRQQDNRSTLHFGNVADTCGKCHKFIDEHVQQSVHGAEFLRSHTGVDNEQSQKQILELTCTACHQRHEPASDLPIANLESQSGCGNCHAKLASHHILRNHADLTEHGYQPAATCAECHGSHDILPLTDANSPLSPANRQATCQKCHENAGEAFSQFDPHANYKDATSYPRLHEIHVWIERFTIAVLLFFMFHAMLWIVRSLVQVLKYGGHRHVTSDRRAIIRFAPTQLLLRSVIMISLLGLAETGLLLKYADYGWAQTVTRYLGGMHFTGLLHRAFGVGLLAGSVAHVVWVVRDKQRGPKRTWTETLFGPDSPIPNTQDFKDMLGMFRWFIGMGPKPTFERWTYWEKFDYWAMASIIVFIGLSGCVVWLPHLFAPIVGGAGLNEAQMIHHKISLMATSFLLAIRYVNTHFRPEKFPMDMSVMTGLVSEDHLERARPKFLDRMRREGRLDQLETTFPSRRKLVGIIIAAGVTHVLVLLLLAVILVASLST